MTKHTDHGQGAVISDLERAVAYYEKNITAADVERGKTTDMTAVAEIDRQQNLRRGQLVRLQAELDRARTSAEPSAEPA